MLLDYTSFIREGFACPGCKKAVKLPFCSSPLTAWISEWDKLTAAKDAEAIDLTSDEPVVADGPSITAEECACKCGKKFCVACGSDISGKMEGKSHLSTCSLRYVYKVMECIERVRQAASGDQVIPAPKEQLVDVAPAKVQPHLKKSSCACGLCGVKALPGTYESYYGYDDEEDDYDDEEDEYYGGIPEPVPYLWGVQPPSVKNAVYGGSAGEGKLVKDAQVKKSVATSNKYHTLTKIIDILHKCVPPCVQSRGGHHAQLLYDTIEEIIDDDGGVSGARGGEIPLSHQSLNSYVETDLATDHPLLLQVMLGLDNAAEKPKAKRGKTDTTPSSSSRSPTQIAPAMLYSVCTDLLRTSVMEISKLPASRDLFRSVDKLLSALASNEALCGFLLYRGASQQAYTHAMEHIRVEGSGGIITSIPSSSVYSLLFELRKQAQVFKKNSSHLSGNAEILIGDAKEDAEYTAVLSLLQELEATCQHITAGVKQWGEVQLALSRILDDDVSEAKAASTAISLVTPTRKAPAAPQKVVSEATMLAECKAAARKNIGGVDPVVLFDCGCSKVVCTLNPRDVSAYESIMKDEAYNTVEDLRAQHTYKSQPASSSSSMKRHMRISAEMANLPSLAVHFASSILVRQDEGNMDYLRALLTGPADTPYMNGIFLFDIFLPAAYPQVSPLVMFLTTGGGYVRFNPNLYAEGKVCLSLLGTWAGPGWEPDVSTLSQVLISIQSQIMNDSPFYNEPGYESQMGKPQGKRNVAKHNMQIRLGTMRYAMIEPLKKPPVGFERAVQTHFYYKRDEIKAQILQWVLDAKAFAVFEDELYTRADSERATYTANLKAEIARFVPAKPAVAPPASSGKKRSRNATFYPGMSYVASYDNLAGVSLPAGFTVPAALQKGTVQLRQTMDCVSSWESARGFSCFPRGVGHLPKADISSLAPNAKKIVTPSRGTNFDYVAAIISAADELTRLLGTVKEPEEF